MYSAIISSVMEPEVTAKPDEVILEIEDGMGSLSVQLHGWSIPSS